MFKILFKFFDFCGEKNKKKLYGSLACGVLQAIFEALRVPAIAVMLAGVIKNDVTTATIRTSFFIMFVSIIGSGLAKYRATVLQTEACYETCANKRVEMAEHLRYLPMGYFNQNSLGYITSVITNAMEDLSDVAVRVVMLISQGIITTALMTLMVLLFDWRIGLVMLAGLCIFFVANTGLQKASDAVTPRKIEADTRLVEKILEYIQGIAEVKSYNLMGSTSRKLNVAIDENVKTNTDMEFEFIPHFTIQGVITKVFSVAMSLLSIFLYLRGTMELLTCIVMVISSFMIYTNLDSAGSYSSLLRILEASVDKAEGILSIEPMDISGKEEAPADFNINVKNIGFSYGERKIMDDLSVTIPERTTTAIVGPSGGGKSTLCSLISRFWDVQEGSVEIGGTDVREYSMDSLMKNFSFVFQRVYLFQDTIANNIRFGQPDAPMEQVMEAAKKACCHDFIMKLPKGYDTVIGEGGASLSGGERQRISIARAIMKDAPVIILDEATESVDPENEKSLIDAIDALTREKTIIMIAHRLKTVRNADQILVIDHGKIVQKGRHEELMQEDGIYKRFVCARSQAVGWKI